MLRTRFWILICFGVTLLAWLQPMGSRSFAALDAPAEGVNSIASTFVIHGFEKPVRLRLTCLTGGKPWKQRSDEAHAAYLKALFSFLDSDENGSLSRDEVRQLPAPRSNQTSSVGGEVYVAFNYRVLDTDGDGAVSPAELESYLSSQGETALRFSIVPAEAATDMLFRELDADGDRVLTETEASLVDRLFERDRDGNQVITNDELRGRTMGRLPPEFIATSSGQVSKTGTVRIRQAEGNSDEQTAQALIDVQIEFGANDSATEAPQIRVKLSKEAEELGFRFEQNASGEQVLKCGNRVLILRLHNPTATQEVNVRQTLEQEFASLSGAPAENASVPATSEMSPALKSIFLFADRNGDEQLDQVELQRYFDHLATAQSDANRGRLRAVVYAEQGGLQTLVDLNRDGRLSRRELQGTSKIVKQFSGANGKLMQEDLPLTTLIVLQRGPFLQANDNSMLVNAGPNWFNRADRNGDGDLDRDEFPGSPDDFDKFDRNRDGWIDVEEAFKADSAARGDSQ